MSLDEGINLAKEMNAIFKIISAKEENGGIDELFKTIGKKFMEKYSEITSDMENEEPKNKTLKLTKDGSKIENKDKKKC